MILLFLICGFIIFLLIYKRAKTADLLLQNKFKELGILPGKNLYEIVDKCGLPNAVSTLPDGKILRQWQNKNYHITLLFNENNICLELIREVKE